MLQWVKRGGQCGQDIKLLPIVQLRYKWHTFLKGCQSCCNILTLSLSQYFYELQLVNIHSNVEHDCKQLSMKSMERLGRGLGVNSLPAKGFKRGPPHFVETSFSYRYCRLKPSSSGVLVEIEVGIR